MIEGVVVGEGEVGGEGVRGEGVEGRGGEEGVDREGDVGVGWNVDEVEV